MATLLNVNSTPRVLPVNGVVDKRPELYAQEQELAIITDMAWDVIAETNDPPKLFISGGELIRLETFDNNLIFTPLDKHRMRDEMSRRAFWYRVKENKDTGKKLKAPAMPPIEVMTNMLVKENPPLPVLKRVVEVPVFDRNGVLIEQPGFNKKSGIYYHPTQGLNIPPVSETPSPEEIEAARNLLDEMIGDFPFVDEAEKANAFAVILEPFVREMINGPTPIRLIEAPSPGTGKSILAGALIAPYSSRMLTITQTQEEEEWRKRITTMLRQNAPAILIDNITQPLDSGQLAAAVTSMDWNDRVLGSNQNLVIPIRCLWMATANNPVISTEIARRCVRIRLDAKVDRPWQRTGFKHNNLRGWVEQNRAGLIHAALTLIQAWIAEFMPAGEKLLGSYENWARIMGGILQVAGIEGFLTNLEEFYEVADRETEMWRDFVALWLERHGTSEVMVKDLFDTVLLVEGFNLGTGGERSQRVSFGMMLNRQKDRVFQVGDERYKIQLAGETKRLKKWQLMDIRQVLIE